MQNYPHKKINDKAKQQQQQQKPNCNTTLQNELSCLKEEFQDQKNEHESEIEKQTTEMNKRHQEETEVETRKEITRHHD